MENLTKINLKLSLWVGLGLMVTFFGCSKVEDLINTPVYIDTDILHNALTVQIINADGEWNNRPSNIKVEVMGDDKDKIYSLVGEREIKVLDNHVKIGIRKIELPTPDNPIEFSVKVTADGFLPTVHNYTITSDQPTFTFLSMVKKDDAPANISMERNVNIANTASGIDSEAKISTSLDGVSSSLLQWEFAKGTQFLDNNGETLGSNLSVDLYSSGNNSEVAQGFFPGGNFGYVMEDGQKIKRNLNPAAFGYMQMKSGSKEVKSLSQPATFTIAVNHDFVNPATGAQLKEDDDLELWGLDLSSNQWTKMDEAKVKVGFNGLEAAFDMEAIPDYWTVTNSTRATGGVQLTIHSAVGQFAPDKYYYVVIRQIPYPAGCCNQIIYEGYEKMYDKQTFHFTNLPTSGAGIVEVYSSKYECNNKELLDDVLFFWEARGKQDFGSKEYSRVNIFLDPATINSNGRFTITVDVFGVCSDGDTVLRGVPSLDLQYSGIYCNQGEYELLGRLQSGIGTTGALVPGQNYNFYFEQGPVSRSQINFPIPTQDTTYQIASPVYDFYEDVFVDFNDADQSIYLKWHNVAVPDKACEEYKRYY